MVNPERREAWVALNLAPGFSSSQIRALAESFGGPREVLQAGAEALQQSGGLSARVAARMMNFDWKGALEIELRRAEALKVRIVTLDDPDYPIPLGEIYDPPPVLYLLGRLMKDESLSIAVVGTRRPTPYGRRMAARLARELTEQGVTVVSGWHGELIPRPMKGPWKLAAER